MGLCPLVRHRRKVKRTSALGMSGIPGPMEYRLIEAGLNKATTQECHCQEPFNSGPWGSNGDGREKGAHIY